VSPTITETFTITLTLTPAPTLAAADVRTGEIFSYPNPFVPGAALLTFRFDAATQVDVAIYDWSGRKVFDLPAANIQAAQGVAFWDGRLADGQFAAPGLYFVVLKGSQGRATRKLTIIWK
jgi:hypothetical protein